MHDTVSRLQLKDEVVLLKAAVRSRDAKLADAEHTTAELKGDLLESKQQVGLPSAHASTCLTAHRVQTSVTSCCGCYLLSV